MQMNIIAFPTNFPLPTSSSTVFASADAQGLPQPQSSGSSSFAPLRILTVDDEPAICEIIRIFLSSEGHTVESAKDGAQGLERFNTEHWDVVLVDRAMPKMSGGELAQEIKRRDPHMPVVLVSGSPQRAQPAGETLTVFDAIVRKPFTLATLREGIARALHAA